MQICAACKVLQQMHRFHIGAEKSKLKMCRCAQGLHKIIKSTRHNSRSLLRYPAAVRACNAHLHRKTCPLCSCETADVFSCGAILACRRRILRSWRAPRGNGGRCRRRNGITWSASTLCPADAPSDPKICMWRAASALHNVAAATCGHPAPSHVPEYSRGCFRSA